jgi:hypothetical protein
MGLMPMQIYRDRDDRHMRQDERDQEMSPPRQIKDSGRDQRQILPTAELNRWPRRLSLGIAERSVRLLTYDGKID